MRHGRVTELAGAGPGSYRRNDIKQCRRNSYQHRVCMAADGTSAVHVAAADSPCVHPIPSSRTRLSAAETRLRRNTEMLG